MRALVWSSLLLGACAPESHQPNWVEDDWASQPDGVEDDWASQTLYFRTIGELAPEVDLDDVDAEETGSWGGFEEWRIEDVDGKALCTIHWESTGADAGFDCGAECDRGWDLVCFGGEQAGACDPWFDVSTITMSSALDVAYRADEGAVYMRTDVGDGWAYQAAGEMTAGRLTYDERFAF